VGEEVGCLIAWISMLEYFRYMTATLLKTETLSAISRDIAQVLFAGLFIEPIANGHANIYLIALGLLLSFGTWFSSLLLAKS